MKTIKINLKTVFNFCFKQFKNWWNKWNARISKNQEDFNKSLNLMRQNNPVFIPRNHKVNEAISYAEKYGEKELKKREPDPRWPAGTKEDQFLSNKMQKMEKGRPTLIFQIIVSHYRIL